VHLASEKLFINLLRTFRVVKLVQFERLPVAVAHILMIFELFKVREKKFKFTIFLVVVEWHYWYAIFNLKAKRVSRIVNKHNIFEASVCKNTQIFDINTLWCLNTVLTEKLVMDVLILWI
jgi:hypothetical protein